MKKVEFILSFVLLVSLYLVTLPLSLIWKIISRDRETKETNPFLNRERAALRLVK